jgi:putative ABC transport system permease protein
MLRNKTVSAVHVIGFGLGIGAFLFVAQVAVFEYSFDKFHTNGDRIYKLTADYTWPDGVVRKSSGVEPAFAPMLKNAMPEITHVARFIPQLLEEPYCVITYSDARGDKRSFNEPHAWYVDEDFLKIFKFPVVQGSQDPLQGSTGLVMTRSCARKYFGDDNAVGKILELKTGGTESVKTRFVYQVEAVLEDLPKNSSIQFDILLPFRVFEDNFKVDVRTNWRWHGSFHTAIEVHDHGVNIPALESKIYDVIPGEVRNNWEALSLLGATYQLQNISQVHFDAERTGYQASRLRISDKRSLLIVVLIGFAILVIAEMNYISLTTAKALKRVKEVSIRKVVGAGRRQLIGHFLLDAMINVFIGIILALTLLQGTKAMLAELLGVSVPTVVEWNVQLIIFVVAFLASVIAMAFVPAYYLSGMFSLSVLKGTLNRSTNTLFLRKCLVVFQFTTSVALICLTYVIVRQLNYMRSQDTGITLDHRIAIRAIGTEDADLQKFRVFKARIERLNNVVSASAGTNIPGHFEGHGPPWSKSGGSDFVDIDQVQADFDYMKTLGIPLLAGREFTEDRMSDERVGILNLSAVRDLGLRTPEEALGKSLFFHWLDAPREVKIIGVVADGNFGSTGFLPRPTVFAFANTAHPFPKYRHYVVHVQPGETTRTVAELEKVWEDVFPNAPFEYFFLDDDFQEVFAEEEKMKSVALLSSALAIIIACMGLGGLVAFTVAQRTKEIGIRKTLGASISTILSLLSRDFIRLIVVAIGVSVPLVWYGVNEILKTYQNRIEVSVWLFMVPALGLLSVAILTMSYQTVKVARSNPVDALKQE